MKRVEENGRMEAGQRGVENLKTLGVEILKTMLLLERPFGAHYVARILRGDDSNYWKSESHTMLETFGSHNDKSREYLRLAIHALVDYGMLEAGSPSYSTLQITNRGRAWLNEPNEIMVDETDLRFSGYQSFVHRKLREYRQARSEKERLPVYQLMSNYTLDRLAMELPRTLKKLQSIPGMNPYKAEAFGAGILSIIQESVHEWEASKRRRTEARIKTSRYQYIKGLLMKQSSLEEMAEKAGLAVNTILRYLRELHEFGELDLRPWIEKRVDKKTLFKGSEYFQKSAEPSLREAFDSLGIDYETLKLCRLYVTGFSSHTEELQLPA